MTHDAIARGGYRAPISGTTPKGRPACVSHRGARNPCIGVARIHSLLSARTVSALGAIAADHFTLLHLRPRPHSGHPFLVAPRKS